jgi:hypothetical protein
LLDDDVIKQMAFPFLLEGGSVNTTMAAGERTLSLVEVPQHPTPSGGFAAEWIDLYGDAMDQALGIEKTSFSALAELNSCAVDACDRLAGDFAETVCNVLAVCLKAQLSWFNRMSEAGMVLMAIPVPAGVLAFVKDASTRVSAGGLDHGSMDLVLGEESGCASPGTGLSRAAAGGSGGPASPAETPERGMDMVIGETAA